MQAVTTIGLDIAKSVFQVHGVDAEGNVIVRRQLKRRYVLAFFQKLPPCLVGIEACASSHHWSRELKAIGHTVRLMPPAYVKPYVKRQKNDATDAEAICEAVTRANMRFVETKTAEQQACLMLHRTRHLFIKQQTSVINAIRAHLAEFGIVARVGRNGVEELLGVVADPGDRRLPEVARACVAALGVQLRMLKAQILAFDRRIMPGTGPTRRANGSIRSRASVRPWPRHWSPACPIRKRSAPEGTSPPGSASCPDSTRAAARTGLAALASKAIATCAAYSPPAHSPSFAMPRSMVPGIDPGSRPCWLAGRPRWPRSRWPTSSPGWLGR
jgi:transposase